MRQMPNVIHDPINPSEGIELPTVSADQWIARVCELVGQDLNKAEIAYAEALAQHYNWTATAVADEIRRNRAAHDMLDAACLMRSITSRSTRADVDRACNALDAAIRQSLPKT